MGTRGAPRPKPKPKPRVKGEKQIKAKGDLYNELILAVIQVLSTEKKYPNETRHETALKKKPN